MSNKEVIETIKRGDSLLGENKDHSTQRAIAYYLRAIAILLNDEVQLLEDPENLDKKR